MNKSFLVKLCLAISLVAAALLLGYNFGQLQGIPTANISSVLDILNDDTSGITWHNQASITLGPKVTFTGTGISINQSQISITQGGSYRLTGTLTNGSIMVDTTDCVNLILDNASITNPSGPAIVIKNADTAYITLMTDTANYLVDGTSYTDSSLSSTLFSNAPLILQGNGAINISAQCKHGIASNDSVTINNGVYTISSIQDGITAKQAFTLNGGSIKINTSMNGIDSDHSMLLNDGVISVTCSTNALLSSSDVIIKGSTINVDNCTNGINSGTNITIDNGNLNLSTKGDALLSGDTTTINNGNVHLASLSHAISSNNALIINNGLVVALTGNSQKESINCKTSFSINGGTLLAAGTISQFPDQATSTQHTALLRSVSANTLLHVQQEATDILTFLPEENYNNILFSSPLLSNGRSYTVLVGGSISGGTNYYGLYKDCTYTPGQEAYSFSCNDTLYQSKSFDQSQEASNNVSQKKHTK